MEEYSEVAKMFRRVYTMEDHIVSLEVGHALGNLPGKFSIAMEILNVKTQEFGLKNATGL